MCLASPGAPQGFVPTLRDQLADACRQGGTSFFTSGIDPGLANGLLPLTLTGLCGNWQEGRVQEIINYATYNQPTVLFDTMGSESRWRTRTARSWSRRCPQT